MKPTKTLLSLLVASFVMAGVAFASDQKPATAEAKPAKCCAKAAKDGKTCDHECCAEAAKAGKNCDKCGGSGMAEAKK